MKALVLILTLSTLTLIGCGKMETSAGTAGDALANMNAQGTITDAEANSVSEELLAENVQLAEMNGPSSIMMKVGGAELLIDFIKDIQGTPDETALVINGVSVPLNVLQNPQNFQALVASLVTSQLQGVDILGASVSSLIKAGLNLIKVDSGKADFSNLFGTLIKGAMGMFLNGTPYGSLFNVIGSIVGNTNQNNSSQQGHQNNNQNQNNNNSGSEDLGSIVNTIGGVLGSSNPLLGGFLSLITNLFK